MNNKEAIKKYNISLGLPNPCEKVILVDCMDTILHRDVSLESLLSIWAKKMSKEFGIYSKFLYHYRLDVVSSSMHNTVPIEVIYGEIYDHCHHFGLIHNCSKNEFITKAHSMELDIEVKFHHPITGTIDFLKASKAKGAKIYCVSDFRLSKTDLLSFFSHLGIDDIFTDIISSCDAGMTKKEGSLYGFVLDQINKPSSECIMIGDNLKSDCINASKNGIKSYWLKNNRQSYMATIKDLLIRYI
jgi:FMN phosphatase YigB (HAD superfamily)